MSRSTASTAHPLPGQDMEVACEPRNEVGGVLCASARCHEVVRRECPRIVSQCHLRSLRSVHDRVEVAQNPRDDDRLERWRLLDRSRQRGGSRLGDASHGDTAVGPGLAGEPLHQKGLVALVVLAEEVDASLALAGSAHAEGRHRVPLADEIDRFYAPVKNGRSGARGDLAPALGEHNAEIYGERGAHGRRPRTARGGRDLIQ